MMTLRSTGLRLLALASVWAALSSCEAAHPVFNSNQSPLSVRPGGSVNTRIPPIKVTGAKTAVPPPPKSAEASTATPAKSAVATSSGAAASDHHGELMSSQTAIANVLADLCPHGMLPIAFGMAAGGGTGPVLSTIILAVFGFLSWYSLVSFARAAETVIVQADAEDAGESLSAVWARTLKNGATTTFIPDLGCVCLTVGCLLFYSAFIGDIFGSLVSGLTFLPDVMRTRWSVLLLLHIVPILPLCLTRDLSALKYSSMTGLVGIFYTVFFVGKRLLDGSYAAGGKFFDLMPKRFHPAEQLGVTGDISGPLGYLSTLPAFQAKGGLLTLMNMCCVAYACHYNAVKYYMELEDRSIPNLKKVMAAGIGGTGFVFWCMMLLGYATFGANAQALLLNNYHGSKDIMATFARLFTGIAIISGYALMFAGLKASLFSLVKLDRPNVEKQNEKQDLLSVLFLAAIAICACFVTEHELATVIGIVGSVFGSIVIYMFPAFVNNSLLKMTDKKGMPLIAPFFKGESIFNNILVFFGLVFAVLGTWTSLQGDGH